MRIWTENAVSAQNVYIRSVQFWFVTASHAGGINIINIHSLIAILHREVSHSKRSFSLTNNPFLYHTVCETTQIYKETIRARALSRRA